MLDDAGVLVRSREQPTTRRYVDGKIRYTWRIPADILLTEDDVAEYRAQLMTKHREADLL